MNDTLEKLKYPIGRFQLPKSVTQEDIEDGIETLKNLPAEISRLLTPLLDKQLDYQYRPDGWNIREVVHHCADSHMNSLIRFKLALTEDQPVIKPYKEDVWSTLNDYKDYNLEASLIILKGVHQKLVRILSDLEDDGFSRTFVHPEHSQVFRIDQALMMYSWHSRHHLAHIEQALRFNGKFDE